MVITEKRWLYTPAFFCLRAFDRLSYHAYTLFKQLRGYRFQRDDYPYWGNFPLNPEEPQFIRRIYG
jgi:hypothetical protein